ncbi:MAG: hypothetical protein ACR2IJ_05130 [Fluviibacter sp.]
MFWFEFSGQLVEPFDTLAEAQAVCDEQVKFWIDQGLAYRKQELAWDDVSDQSIRSACSVTYSVQN